MDDLQINKSLKEEIGISTLDQIGLVVNDIKHAIATYSSMFNLGPFRILIPKFYNKTYYGKPSDFTMKIAFAKWGGLGIELIEPLEGKNIYFDFLKRNPNGGLHHFGYEVKNLERSIRAFDKIGCKVIQGGRVEGGGHAYLDTEHRFGCILEVIQTPPGWPPEEDYI